MENVFGHIENNIMELSTAGIIASEEWIKTPQIRTNVELDAFIIMPDHIHGILKIKPVVGATGSVAHLKGDGKSHKNTNRISYSRNDRFFFKCIDPDFHKKFNFATQKSLQPNSLGSIIGQYKSVVTKRIRRMGMSEFQWQSNYYDRIIRSKPELIAIRKYILENPLDHK
jgi:REP element-mobilizing transposase RayT